MKQWSIVRYLQISGSIGVVSDGEPRWRLPQRPAGRFAPYLERNGGTEREDQAQRAAAVERCGLPQRHARAILM